MRTARATSPPPIRNVFRECVMWSPDAPCAVGGILSVETVPRLRCRIVAGSANNQRAEPEAAEMLHGRGILYAPDYVINAGGALAIVGFEQLGWSDSESRTLRGCPATLPAQVRDSYTPAGPLDRRYAAYERILCRR
jgi:Glutamate/Leucine/Phenylalanine/Valine dehydrogenase